MFTVSLLRWCRTVAMVLLISTLGNATPSPKDSHPGSLTGTVCAPPRSVSSVPGLVVLDEGSAETAFVCAITLDVDVSSCWYDEQTGENKAIVNVEVSWIDPPGPAFTESTAGPRMDSIRVMVAGQAKYAYLEAPFVNRAPDVVGYYPLSSPQVVKFEVPADGATAQTITAAFTGTPSCMAADTYSRPTTCDPAPCPNMAGTVGGNVYEDFNANGMQDAGEPTGLGGMTVMIFGCDADGNSVALGTTTTDNNGDYFFNGLTDGQDYRVEFSFPAGTSYLATFAQPAGASAVQFVEAPSCGVDLGVIDPALSCTEEPTVLATCYVSGVHTSSRASDFGTIIAYPYDAQGTGINQGESGTANEYYGYHNQTGSVFGLAFRISDSLLFSSAILRRQSGLGPLGIAGLYVTDLTQPPGTNGNNAPTSNFLDLSFGGMFDFGTVPARPDLGTSPTSNNNRDGAVLPFIGTIGIGDMDIGPNGNTLYVTNLNDMRLYVIDISGYDGSPATTPTAADVTPVAYPNPCGGTGVVRPWALKVRGDEVLVGLVCDASTTDLERDLRAYVYTFSTLTNTFNPTPVFDFALTYPRGAGTLDPGLWQHNVWEPWSNDWNGTIADQNDWYFINDGTVNGNPRRVYDYPQPILADIAIDVDNTLVLVFNDRTSLQIGNLERAPTGNTFMGHTAAGDILRAFTPDGTSYFLESQAVSGGLTGVSPNNFQGPGYGEFYDDNFFAGPRNFVHSELVVGGAALPPGSGFVTVATVDPVNGVNFAGGTRTFDNLTGQVESAYTIYRSNADPSSPTFGKTAGIGDLEVMCGFLFDLEIGDRVWIDQNADGVQDPCEPPLAGVTVELYTDDGTLVATTTTDAQGNYYFSEDGVANQVWETTGGAVMESTDYQIVFGNGQFNGDELLVVNGMNYSVTQDNTGQGPNNDRNDSDPDPDNLSLASNDLPAGLPFLSLTTGVAGEVGSFDHSFDAGFILQAVSVGSTVFADPNNDGVQNADEDGIADVLVVLYADDGDGVAGSGGDLAVVTGADGIPNTADDAFGPDGISGTADDGQPGMLTDADGLYIFAGLPEGDYYLEIPTVAFGTGAPLADQATSSNTTSGTFAGETDPDADPTDGDDEGLQPAGNGTTVTSNVVTLETGQEPVNSGTETASGNEQDDSGANVDADGNMTLDFGFFGPVTVGDTTFVDLDLNGIQSPGDDPLAGVTVTLFNADGTQVMTDADGNPITGQVTTNADGSYQFANLPPGNYYVVFDVSTAPGAEFYELIGQDQGNDDANDSDANPANGQTGNTGFVPGGGAITDLDAGVSCIVEAEAGLATTVCTSQAVRLGSLGAGFAPTTVAGFGATWTSSGTGTFDDGNAGRFGTAQTYTPSTADRSAGQVTLTLTTDDPAAFGNPTCGPETDEVVITILSVDCGSFPWSGNSGE